MNSEWQTKSDSDDHKARAQFVNCRSGMITGRTDNKTLTEITHTVHLEWYDM